MSEDKVRVVVVQSLKIPFLIIQSLKIPFLIFSLQEILHVLERFLVLDLRLTRHYNLRPENLCQDGMQVA